MAFRVGGSGRPNRPGDPAEIVRLDVNGKILGRLQVEGNVTRALVARHISSVKPLEVDTVGPNDALLQAPGGALFAIAARSDKAALALLRRDEQGRYGLLFRQRLNLPARGIRVHAHAAPGGAFVAVVIEAHAVDDGLATLWLLPSDAIAEDALPAAADSTPTTE